MPVPDASAMVLKFTRLHTLDPGCYQQLLAAPDADFPGLPPLVIDDLCAVSSGRWRLLPHAERWVRRYFAQWADA
jgi:hypothetical protein